MKKITKKILILLLGAGCMVTFNGCSDAGKYKKYSSVDTELNITMDHVSDWWFREVRGANNSYAEVFFGEPRKKDEKGISKAFISVISVESLKTGVAVPTLETVADDISSKNLNFKDSKLISKTKIKLPAGEAIDLIFSYKTLNKLYSMDAKLIPARERIVILKNGNRFYTVRYKNKEEDFNRFDKDFDHIIKSIRFKEKR